MLSLNKIRIQRLVMVVCAAMLLVSSEINSRKSQDIPTLVAICPLSSGRVTVKVSGDVTHPGVYEVPANSMAESVIIMAMPLRPLKPYSMYSSVCRPLVNGSAVKLTTQSERLQLMTLEQMTVSERLVLNIPLDISSMSEIDFDRLPGIGPSLANRIIMHRQNNGGILRLEDLESIEGIGEKKYKNIKKYF